MLFLLPGYALLAVARPRLDLGPLEGLIVSAGLSVAVVPLLLYFSSLAGVELNSFSVGAIFILLGALALWRSLPQMRRMVGNPRLRWARRGWRVRLGQVRSLWKGGITEGQAFYTALALVFLMAFVVRFYVVRDLVVPPGGDSVHHAMITQLLVDNGGLFESWEPYAPLSSFTYHFGFHALAAFYHWLTGVTVIRSVILTGQIINFLAVPLMYFLTERLTKSRWAGLFAALVPGFLCLMPMYYVNWGRYTQLAGQTILPVAMIFTAGNVGARRKDLGAMAITVLALAGLLLTHYFVAAFFVCFLMALLVAKTCVGWRNRQPVARMWLTTLIVVACALALVLPWLVNLMTGPLVQRMLGSWNAEMPRAEISWGQQYNGVLAFSDTGDVFFFLPWYVFVLAALGTALAVMERRIEVIAVIVWTLLLFLIANPHVVHLPGTGLVNNTTIMIALYIPASLLVGWFVGRLIDSARTRAQGIPHMAGIAALACALASQGSMVGVLRPESVFVTESDIEAMGSIKDHTDEDAKFLVSTVLWEGPQSVVGTDAGWWLPLLTGREGTVPPMVYKEEDSSERNYVAKTNAFAAAVRDADFGAADILRRLKDHAVTHVFIGQQGATLQPASFLGNPCYELLYHRDEVWVFEVLYDCVHASGESHAARNACRAKHMLPNSHQLQTP